MNNKYALVRENGEQWINSPNNGGECCETKFETVAELNRLLDRIKQLEEQLAESNAHRERLIVSSMEAWARVDDQGGDQ